MQFECYNVSRLNSHKFISKIDKYDFPWVYLHIEWLRGLATIHLTFVAQTQLFSFD
jgi:hypothetical protein